ncbi:MAG: hypothetical protein ABS45_12355 [Comamonas sp. SCN 65-56]|uniref:hypothetical protein n=1 Tax=Comamonas sp. SCN 65-56 TaxID=1660095 RepID=UPI00086BC6F8|nr:hypothetical protein [Comamonas sp. SCN 65-56]ODS91224.1 MAG: hypothetical protein ABS45_12355 [Comamonas sp. SCN 65-56]
MNDTKTSQLQTNTSHRRAATARRMQHMPRLSVLMRMNGELLKFSPHEHSGISRLAAPDARTGHTIHPASNRTRLTALPGRAARAAPH